MVAIEEKLLRAEVMVAIRLPRTKVLAAIEEKLPLAKVVKPPKKNIARFGSPVKRIDLTTSTSKPEPATTAWWSTIDPSELSAAVSLIQLRSISGTMVPVAPERAARLERRILARTKKCAINGGMGTTTKTLS